MNHWSEHLQLTSSDPTFTLCEVSAMLSVLAQRGISASAVFDQCQVRPDALRDPNTRISLEQQVEIHRASAALYRDSRLLPLVAQRLHLTTFGIVGYALLSCQNLGELIQFADAYSPLLNLKFKLKVSRDGFGARLSLLDRYKLDASTGAAFKVLELAKSGVLLRDVLGQEFKPERAYCAGADATELGELAEILGCPVQASDTKTEICFNASLLEQDLPQSNASTHASCQHVCDGLMTKLASGFNLERHVREIMLKATGRPPTLPELADELCISQRTLRRRLDALNTSYNQILEDVRKELAFRYLTTTHSTTEQIAQFLGYSEAANFRHAFKRWTGQSPKDYRASHAETASVERVRRFSSSPRRPAVRQQHSVLLAEAVACWSRAEMAAV